MIRLQIVDAKRNAPVAPPLVVAVRADAELSCLAEKATVCSAQSGGQLKAQSETQARTTSNSGPRDD